MARTLTSENQQVLETQDLRDHYHKPHGVHDGKPPASATPRRFNNVLASDS